MLQLAVNGLAVGSVHALVALGLLLIFNSVRIVNFAQGQLLMLGAFLGVTAAVQHELPVALAWALTLPAMALIGIAFMAVVYAPPRGRPPFLIILTTIAMGVALGNLALIAWGPLPVSLPSPAPGPPLRFGAGAGSASVSRHQLVIFGATALVLLVQHLLFTRTRFGLLMRATAQDLGMARLAGVRVGRTVAAAFAGGAALAGLAGLLVAPLFLAEPTMGGSLGLKGFVVSVVGGFGSLPGAVVGGLGLGLLKTFGARYLSSEFRDAYAFAVMIAMLAFRPRGLFGERADERV